MLEKFKNKKIYIILIILMIVAVLSVGTYALLLWSSEENTEMTLRIGDFAEVIFPPLNEDTDPSDGITISGNQVTVSNMGPIFDYEKDGATLEFSIINLSSDVITSNASLHITTISDNLKADDFKMVVLHSEDNTNYTKILETDFSKSTNESNIELFSELKVLDKSYFKVIFYIDGNMLNDSSIQGGSLSAYITVDAIKPAHYLTNLNCTSASAEFDYTKKCVFLSNVNTTGPITFSLTKSPTERTYFNDYIISLLGNNTSISSESTAGNGSTLEIINSTSPLGTSTDYRYIGKSPANYVMFNDELWRIIGVFDSNSHGIANTNLVKIIRNDSIGGYIWDSSRTKDDETTTYGRNNFPDSDIYNLLNRAYYNDASIDAEPFDATNQDYCLSYVYIYGNTTATKGKCDFTRIGIRSGYKKMIEENATWYLGGNTFDSISEDEDSDFYNKERNSTKVYSGNEFSIVAPIGLMYASDFLYAFSGTENLSGNNWLEKYNFEWTITHDYLYSYHIIALTDGQFDNAEYEERGYAANGYNTRPVLYLDSSVYYLSGTGTAKDPYIISIN